MTLKERHVEGLTLRGFNEKARTIECVMSSDVEDSYGESVHQASWRLERFLTNPVVLFAHNSREMPVGKASNVGVRDGKLQATITFASEKANPKAEQLWNLVREGVIRAVSVGFVPGVVRTIKRGAKDIVELADCTLHELSVVPIGANVDALMRSKGIGHEARAAIGHTVWSASLRSPERPIEQARSAGQALADLINSDLDHDDGVAEFAASVSRTRADQNARERADATERARYRAEIDHRAANPTASDLLTRLINGGDQ